MNIHKPYTLLYLYTFSHVRCLLSNRVSITMEFLLLHTIHIITITETSAHVTLVFINASSNN